MQIPPESNYLLMEYLIKTRALLTVLTPPSAGKQTKSDGRKLRGRGEDGANDFYLGAIFGGWQKTPQRNFIFVFFRKRFKRIALMIKRAVYLGRRSFVGVVWLEPSQTNFTLN